MFRAPCVDVGAWSPRDAVDSRLLDELPVHVVVALDHLSAAERDGVLAAISAFAHHERAGVAIPGPEPLFLLWATPDLRVIVRRGRPEGPVEVEDVVRSATLRAFAAAQAA